MENKQNLGWKFKKQVHKHSWIGVPKWGVKRVGKLIWGNNGWKLPQHGEENRISRFRKQRLLNKMNPKRSMPRDIITQTEKFKEQILKGAKEKTYYTKGKPQTAISRFTTRTFAGQKKNGATYSKCWKEKTSIQELFMQQDYHSEFKNKETLRVFQTSKG